jgi:hypothetical protein
VQAASIRTAVFIVLSSNTWKRSVFFFILYRKNLTLNKIWLHIFSLNINYFKIVEVSNIFVMSSKYFCLEIIYSNRVNILPVLSPIRRILLKVR